MLLKMHNLLLEFLGTDNDECKDNEYTTIPLMTSLMPSRDEKGSQPDLELLKALETSQTLYQQSEPAS